LAADEGRQAKAHAQKISAYIYFRAILRVRRITDFGSSCHYRVLPFLKEDTILSAGRQVPTKDFAESMSCMFSSIRAHSISYRNIAVLLLASKDMYPALLNGVAFLAGKDYTSVCAF
jgi:hypothetical protein